MAILKKLKKGLKKAAKVAIPVGAALLAARAMKNKSDLAGTEDGKGGIYIKSMGNSFYDSATNGLGCGEAGVDPEGALGCSIRFHDSIHTTPYILGVASLKATGVKSSYSSTDPSIWVSGFGGEFGYSEEYIGDSSAERAYEPAMVTTDQSTCLQGYVGVYSFPRNRFNDYGYLNPNHPDNNNCNYKIT